MRKIWPPCWPTIGDGAVPRAEFRSRRCGQRRHLVADPGNLADVPVHDDRCDGRRGRSVSAKAARRGSEHMVNIGRSLTFSLELLVAGIVGHCLGFDGGILLHRLAAQRLRPLDGVSRTAFGLLLVLLAVIVLQPAGMESKIFRPEEKPTIAVLWDDSAQHGHARRGVRRRRPRPPIHAARRSRLAERIDLARFGDAVERGRPAVLVRPGRPRHESARAAGRSAGKIQEPGRRRAGLRRRLERRAAAGQPRPVNCGSRAFPCSPCRSAAPRGCPTSSCSVSTRRRSASPARRCEFRSRSRARCRASFDHGHAARPPTATR